jgi:uncharacterized cupin superfamily protein
MSSDREKTYLIRAADVTAETRSFSHPWNPRSDLHGVHLSRAAGLARTGVSFVRIPSGKEAFPYHSHRHEEEWIYVLEGRGIALIDEVEYEVGPGDFMGFATPSLAHLMKNPGPAELVYLMGGEHREFEVSEFPHLRKRMVRSGEQLQIYDFSDAKELGPLE